MKRLATLLILLPLLAGCTEPYASLAANQPTPTNSAASHLDVQIGMHLDDQRQILIAFTFAQHGAPVRFTHGESVRCNGVPLAHNGPIVYAYSVFIPLPVDGHDITCYYDSGGVYTTLTLPAPFPPDFTGIQPQQRLRRTTAFAVAWPAVKGAEVQPGADNGLGSAATALPVQPDSGHATLDTAKLTSGSGTLYVIRTQRLVIAHSGFHTCEVNTTASSVIPVIWT